MFVVTGASGRVGRKVIHELIKRGVEPNLIVGSVRDPGKAEDLVSQGIVLRTADYDDRPSLEQAFLGAQKVYFVPGMGTNEVRMRQCQNAIDAAKENGVEHYLAYSFSDPDPSAPFLYNAYYFAKEKHLEESGLSYSALRVPIMADLTMINIMHAMKTGEFCLPLETGKVALVSSNDIAGSAAGAFLIPTEKAKNIYEITGPAALGLEEITERVNRVFEKKFVPRAVSGDEWGKILKETIGMSDYGIKGSISMWKSASENRYAKVTKDVEELAGRPGQPLADLLGEIKKQMQKMTPGLKTGRMSR